MWIQQAEVASLQKQLTLSRKQFLLVEGELLAEDEKRSAQKEAYEKSLAAAHATIQALQAKCHALDEQLAKEHWEDLLSLRNREAKIKENEESLAD
jgi:hypothetical protein